MAHQLGGGQYAQQLHHQGILQGHHKGMRGVDQREFTIAAQDVAHATGAGGAQPLRQCAPVLPCLQQPGGGLAGNLCQQQAQRAQFAETGRQLHRHHGGRLPHAALRIGTVTALAVVPVGPDLVIGRHPDTQRQQGQPWCHGRGMQPGGNPRPGCQQRNAQHRQQQGVEQQRQHHQAHGIAFFFRQHHRHVVAPGGNHHQVGQPGDKLRQHAKISRAVQPGQQRGKQYRQELRHGSAASQGGDIAGKAALPQPGLEFGQHAQPSAFFTAATMASWVASSRKGCIGRLITRLPAASASGKLPSPWPRWAKAGCRCSGIG